MSASATPEEKSAKLYAEALAREVPLLQAFQRGLRITDELYQRLEREMYAGMAYKASDGSEGPTKGFYNSQHARDAVSLSRALSQMGAVHARLLENEAARAESMSDEEKIRFMVRHLRSKPYSIRQAVVAELLAP